MNTSLPWKPAEEGELTHHLGDEYWVHRVFSLSNAELAPANGYGETEEEARANAEIIAKAVNHHDELVKALNYCVGFITKEHSDTEQDKQEVLEIAREILAKVAAAWVKQHE